MLSDEQIYELCDEIPGYSNPRDNDELLASLLKFARAIEAAAHKEQREKDVRLLRDFAQGSGFADWLAAQPLSEEER